MGARERMKYATKKEENVKIVKSVSNVNNVNLSRRDPIESAIFYHPNMMEISSLFPLLPLTFLREA